MSLQAALDRLEKKIGQRVASIALEIQSEARENATGRNGGPRVQTGNLRGAIQAVPIGPLEWHVGVTGSPNPESGTKASEYGKHLERGTRNMPAKPFMRPAVEAVKAKAR